MLGKTLSYQLKRGKLSLIGKPLYETLIKAELFYIHLKEGKKAFENTALADDNLTAIIKTFERPEILARLIGSIKRLYPRLEIIVVDDSKNPSFTEGVQNITLPYDSGVSAGRQKALETVATPYVLLLDDDFVFYRETKLESALKKLMMHPEIDIMGGEVVNLPSFKSTDYSKANLHPTNAKAILELGSIVGGMPVYDKVPNFYIARTERLKLVGWDARIKRLDHADFFTRAKGVLTTVYNDKFKILHAQTPFNKYYMTKRHDIDQDRLVLKMKYYLS